VEVSVSLSICFIQWLTDICIVGSALEDKDVWGNTPIMLATTYNDQYGAQIVPLLQNASAKKL